MPVQKKSLQAKIENNDFELIINLAQKQEKRGALCIDINPGNENLISKENIRKLINELDKYSSLPLSLDIQNQDFIETALQEYPGRALINSTTCEKEKLKRILTLLKKYGGMLVVLAMENEVPETYLQRIKVIKEAIKQIRENEIDLNRIYFDPLILPFASNNDYHVPLKVIEYLNKIGLKSIIGLSNLSFAMPEREKINSAFLCLAIEKGLNAAILDTSSNITMDILKGSLILSGKEVIKIEKEDEEPIIKIILNGEKENLLNIIKEKLNELSPLNISNEFLFNLMKKIGDLYSDGKIFLPHLLIASETAQVAFDYLNSLMQKDNNINRGKILLATVEGDIHDIGKKIVATVLKSYGFEIVDAGKNVNKEFLLKQIMSEKPDIIGLSAMMTTTVNEIKNIAELLKEKKINIPIIAGGASMNQKIADQFKVLYAKDPFEAIKIIDEIKKQK